MLRVHNWKVYQYFVSQLLDKKKKNKIKTTILLGLVSRETIWDYNTQKKKRNHRWILWFKNVGSYQYYIDEYSILWFKTKIKRNVFIFLFQFQRKGNILIVGWGYNSHLTFFVIAGSSKMKDQKRMSPANFGDNSVHLCWKLIRLDQLLWRFDRWCISQEIRCSEYVDTISSPMSSC